MQNLMNEFKSTAQLVHVGFWQKKGIHTKEIIDERLEIVQIKNKLHGYIVKIETYDVM